MNCIYKEYRRWLDGVEAHVRQYLPGWNISLQEHRKGFFCLIMERPFDAVNRFQSALIAGSDLQGPHPIYMREDQVEFLETASREEIEDFIKDFVSLKGPLGA
jgi:hypothetical protein